MLPTKQFFLTIVVSLALQAVLGAAVDQDEVASGQSRGLGTIETVVEFIDPLADVKPETKEIYVKHNVSAPIYFQHDREFTEARLNLDRRGISSMLKILNDMSEQVIKKDRSIVNLGFKAVLNLSLTIADQQAESRELDETDPSPKYKDEYLGDMARLLNEILDSESNEHLDNEATYNKLMVLTKCVEELVKKSNTGLYMDWRELRVDGVLLLDYVKPIVQWFRVTGRDAILTRAKDIANSIQKLADERDRRASTSTTPSSLSLDDVDID